ncbi:TetR/AcrR family transcriptional regulator [Actinomadura kijaniata]|uniref:TetR/AcrR family transcriptional regulator n=1 Tax=Actinomadura kijaniata TaxID=46161 RepID=UPI00082E0B96|nr:TetR/AcrR family transcriptional regulator [Actinomadura kijaniata]
MARRPAGTPHRWASNEREARELEAAWAGVAETETARRLMVAGVLAFAAKGYHATTTRDIAEHAGLSPGGLYVHFRSKEELLYRIAVLGTRQTLERVREAVAEAPDDPEARLRAAILALVERGARYHTTSRVIEDELRSLDDAHRAEVAGLRREIEHTVRAILEDGVRRGVFEVADVPVTALAALSLVVDVARWYRVSGRRSPAEVGALYAELVGRMVRRTA